MEMIIVGAGGMLAADLIEEARASGFAVRALRRADLDVTDLQSCRDALRPRGPRDPRDPRDPSAGDQGDQGPDDEGVQSVVVNCAAWTAVDAAESHEGQAFAVNGVGAANVARACAESGLRLVHISTDYVFAGDAHSPYPVDAPVAPRSAYGRGKAAGEWAVRSECASSWIVRTAWLYGAGGGNFVATMMRLAAERDQLNVVGDQIGQPTWTRDVARAVIALITAQAPFGTYHATSQGQVSWHGFAQAIFAELGLDPARVRAIPSTEYPVPAPRPAYSVLDHSCWDAAGLARLPSWQDALAAALPELQRPSR